MNLPNKLTILRVIMIPFFVFFLLSGVGGSASKWIARYSARKVPECRRSEE